MILLSYSIRGVGLERVWSRRVVRGLIFFIRRKGFFIVMGGKEGWRRKGEGGRLVRYREVFR